jgi:NADH dehydrogenase [ubiquinone] 1 alpha subcomplex assembly factor 5
MAESNALSARRGVLQRDTALAAAALYQAMFSEGDGSVAASFQVMYMTGWAPHSSQPRPKQRGSATVSFEQLAAELEKQGAVTG